LDIGYSGQSQSEPSYLRSKSNAIGGLVDVFPLAAEEKPSRRYTSVGYMETSAGYVQDGICFLRFGIRLLADDEKPEILKSYLDRYKLTVQRYFPVPAGSSTEAFRPLAGEYPVFELVPQR
jgi:hypothetical protein